MPNQFDIVLCSKRLRELRQERQISHQALADAIGVSKQVVINYEQAFINNGISTNSPSDKTFAVAGMKIETLFKLAEYYNVSTDYLLGRTDVKTPDTSISGCTQLTGLSETSIRKLMELNEENRATWYGDVCNSIISNDNFTALVFYLTTLVTRRFSNKKLSEFNYGATVQEVYEGIVSNVFFRLTTDLKEEYKSKLETDCRDAYDLVYGLYRGNKITEEQRDDLIKEFDKGNFDYVPPELRKRKGENDNG